MKIVGCDLHAKQQGIAVVDTETGEFIEKKLIHEGNSVREFYAALEGAVVVGIEATGQFACGIWLFKRKERCSGSPARPLNRKFGVCKSRSIRSTCLRFHCT
jgi:hypothetical protein